MRMIIPIIIIVLGMLSGALVCQLFRQTTTGFKISMISGGIGAFAGLFVRDFFDIPVGGNISGSLIAIISGAVFFSVMTNLFTAKRH